MNKVKKLERNRYSILTNDLTKCIICPKRKDNLHEVYEGKNRQMSMKYGCVIPLCYACHVKIHNERSLALIWKVKTQKVFEKTYPNEDFIKIFGRTYI